MGIMGVTLCGRAYYMNVTWCLTLVAPVYLTLKSPELMFIEGAPQSNPRICSHRNVELSVNS